MTRRISKYLDLEWVGQDRITGYSVILLIAFLPSFLFIYSEAMGQTGSDFLAFWSAGKLVMSDAAQSVYDRSAIFAVQHTVGRSNVFAFISPPPMLFVVAPLGLLPYPVAWGTWIVVTYAIWLGLTRKAVPRQTWPIAAFPGVLVAAWHAQTGLLTSAMQAGLGRNLDKRPLVAGAFIGALIIKPHLAILIPLALTAGGYWRTFASAAVTVALLLVASGLVFGWDIYPAYRLAVEYISWFLEKGGNAFFAKQVTPYAFARAIAGAGPAAALCQGLASLLVAALVWRVWSRPLPVDAKLAVLYAATPLATPYLFSYDLPFLILPILWLARRPAAQVFGRFKRWTILCLYLFPPIAWSVSKILEVNLTLPFLILLMFLTYRCAMWAGPQEQSAAT